MKNRLLLIFLVLNNFFIYNLTKSEIFKIDSSQIDILEKGNLVKAYNGVKVLSKDGTEITGKEVIYNKEKLILEAIGNIVVNDEKNNIIIKSDEIVYNKKKEIISSHKIDNQVIVNDKKNNIIIKSDEIVYNKKKEIISSHKIDNQVILNDKKNNIIIKSDEIVYNKKKEIISSLGDAYANLQNEYEIYATELVHNRNKMEINSSKKSKIKDRFGNIFELESFKFNINEKLLKAKNITLFDTKNNKLNLENSLINLNTNEIIGNEITIDFDNSLFGNKKNEPRLKGRSLISNENESTIYKGSFTTCKKNKDKCPPWTISAREVKHNKAEKVIEYKNAWLEIYDKPVVYFPYFRHPDPTVNRQSGFLAPSFINSNNFGTSLQIPYYNVISESKDLTIIPRIFFDNNIILQTEYRQANKKSDLIADLSINKNASSTKSHFFSNLKGNFNKSSFEINIEKVSNDKYLKINKIQSPLVNNYSTLHSFLNLTKSNENYSLETSFEVYEDLNKNRSDRFEYIYPNFIYNKDLDSLSEQLKFTSTGFQKKYNTNIYEASIINDIKYLSKPFFSANGLKNEYTFLLRNVNKNSNNSTAYKKGNEHKFLSTILFETKYPLKKSDDKYVNYLTPILSARYSPNKTRNIKDLDRRLEYNNIFSVDRIGKNDMVEGGLSLSLGLEYSKKNIEYNDFINLRLATVLRNKEDSDFPVKSTLGQKTSDIVGNLNFIPSKFFNFEYEFSLDNNLNETNYNLVKTNISINNFVTSFEFLQEDNMIGDKSYLSNKSTYIFDESNSISFKTNKNLDKDISEYYTLIYEYKNDCLTAAIEYDKQFYSDSDLKPEKNIFFYIKIIPFGNINSPGISIPN